MFLIRISYSFLILLSLFYRIKGDSNVIKEQRDIASRPQFKNNLVKTPGETVITTAITEDDEKFNDNEPRKVTSKLHENSGGENIESLALKALREQKEKEMNMTLKPGLDCLTCFASANSSDENCYQGWAPTAKCNWAEQCYTEVHPLYIKRGCIIPNRLNMIFVCKCPLCNDKPSSDKAFYTYKTYEEWHLDNILLQKPLVGIDVMCKVCATYGTSGGDDQACRYGRNTDYTICGHGQVCYTNIDDQNFYVSRGCISRPAYNSWFEFCKNARCNNNKHTKSKSLLYHPDVPLSQIMPAFRRHSDRSRSFGSIPAKCEENLPKSKNPLPYFRRQVEGVTDDLSLPTETDDTHNNLVSIFIKNVKEIYNELIEDDIEVSVTFPVSTFKEISNSSTTITENYFNHTQIDDLVNDTFIVTVDNSIEIDSVSIAFPFITGDLPNNTTVTIPSVETSSATTETTKEDELLSSYNNATLVSFSDKELVNMDDSSEVYGLIKKDDMRDLSKKLLFFETDRLEREQKRKGVMNGVNASEDFSYNEKSRSCIYCNNIELENCNEPKNRLIPSILCENDDDLCYSMHTPFGVIDRGCFNINNNLTTFVCTCNLCNYISISEMPYIFSKKKDWIDNVIELSRKRNLRNSVMKELSCLRCEANSTQGGNIVAVSNCLAGNIGSVPTELCNNNEVCAVKSIRKQGYIWRGCVKFPLFNYWWNLCDSDLCNYEVVASIYDTE